jgi:hypothetical protein
MSKEYWKKEQIDLLQEWKDKAVSYKWMYNKSYNLYSNYNSWFTIPVIILSVIAGSLGFAENNFEENIQIYITLGIACFNISKAIIESISKHFKLAEYQEGSRIAFVSWSKYANKIKTELAKEQSSRVPIEFFLQTAQDEYDRLTEVSPPIPNRIVIQFNKKFEDLKIAKPDICSLLSVHEENSNTGLTEHNEVFRNNYSEIFGEYPTSLIDTNNIIINILDDIENQKIDNI